MGNVNLNPQQIARSYDKNGNGVIDPDELQVQAPGLAGPDGKVRVDALANALGNDSVVISNGVVQARQAGAPRDLPIINTLHDINASVQIALGFGSAFAPDPFRYGYTKRYYNHDGSYNDVQKYHWGRAARDLGLQLQIVKAIADQSSDPQARKISDTINQALMTNFLQVIFSDDSQSQYLNMYIAAQQVQQLSEAPPQPSQQMGEMDGRINGAQGKLDTLGGVLGNGTFKDPNLDQKTQAQINAAKNAANDVPVWQKILIFGLFKSHGDNEKAKDLTRDINEYHGLAGGQYQQEQGQLDQVAQQGYNVNQQSWGVNSFDDATRLYSDAQGVGSAADKIGGTASDQTEHLNQLLSNLNGK